MERKPVDDWRGRDGWRGKYKHNMQSRVLQKFQTPLARALVASSKCYTKTTTWEPQKTSYFSLVATPTVHAKVTESITLTSQKRKSLFNERFDG